MTLGFDKGKSNEIMISVHHSCKHVCKSSPCVQEIQQDLALQMLREVPAMENRKNVTKMMTIGKAEDIKEDCNAYCFSSVASVAFRPWLTIYPLKK